MSIFRDVFNEFYVSDTSEKIRNVKKANAEKDLTLSKPSYGYIVDSKDKSVWHIDEEAAEIIRECFRRVIGGEGPTSIAKDFNARGLLSPSAHRLSQKGGSMEKKDTRWFAFSVRTILENEAYVGTMIAHRETTVSCKNHKKIIRPKEDWVVIENRHPAIIDKEVFEVCRQLRINNKQKQTKRGDICPQNGLLFCFDCGARMRIVRDVKYDYYTCVRYQSASKHFARECSRHGIRRNVIEQIALDKIQETVAEALLDKAAFAMKISKASDKNNERTLKLKTAEIAKSERRIIELDKIIKRIYEDNISGRLSDERFDKLLRDYEAEQRELNEILIALRETAEALKVQTANLDSFFKLSERHAEISELSAEIARTFIQKIIYP